MIAPGHWAQLSMSMRDRDGRPLGETKAGPERMCAVPLELRVCPYPGSRHQHERPMNLSALKQVSSSWRGILGGVAFLHRLHRARAGAGALRLADVWRIGNMTNALADFAFLRAWRPLRDGELPSVAGALYKITLGVTSTSAAAWFDGVAPFGAIVDADFLYEYADRYGQLIGPEQVCGGSEAMIKELLRVVLDGLPAFEAGEIACVAGDEARFQRFCDDSASLRLLRYGFDRIDAALRAGLAFELGEPWESALAGDLAGDVRLRRFVALDDAGRLAVLDDLFEGLADERFSVGAGLAATASALRSGWLDEREADPELAARAVDASAPARSLSPAARTTLARYLGRYLLVEKLLAAAVKRLKTRICEDLGVAPGSAQARQRGLDDFQPVRSSRPSMRRVLAEQLGIAVAADGFSVTVTCPGSPPEAPAPPG